MTPTIPSYHYLRNTLEEIAFRFGEGVVAPLRNMKLASGVIRSQNIENQTDLIELIREWFTVPNKFSRARKIAAAFPQNFCQQVQEGRDGHGRGQGI